MLRYAITDGSLRPGDHTGRERLLTQAERWHAAGIGFIQLREKALPAGEVAALARSLLRLIGPATRLLIHARADVAAAVGAGGVHLTSSRAELTPPQVREVFARTGRPAPVVSISCHSPVDVARARDLGADMILYAPVFGKTEAGVLVQPGTGLPALSEACRVAGTVPVLALGGITAANSPECLAAGAAGVAGIRIFG